MKKISVGFESEFRDWFAYARRVIRVNQAPYLYMLKSGRLTFYLGDATFELEPNRVFWWPSGVSTHIECDTPGTQGYIVRLRRSGFASHLQADREDYGFQIAASALYTRHRHSYHWK